MVPSSRWIVRSSRPLRCFPTLLFAILGACTPDAEISPEPSGFTVRDSAGVSIVENTEPAWADGQAWTLSDEPTLSMTIGEKPGDHWSLEAKPVSGAPQRSRLERWLGDR